MYPAAMRERRGSDWWKYALVGEVAFLAGRGSAHDRASLAFLEARNVTLPFEQSRPIRFWSTVRTVPKLSGAPRAGEPGYAPHLDRDGDGVDCE